MFWDLARLPAEPLVKPLIERIHVAMKPAGIMLAFFHTKDAGPEAPFYRYNIAAKDTLELQPIRAFACSASSTTGMWKTSSTIIPPSNFFWAATIFAKCWSSGRGGFSLFAFGFGFSLLRRFHSSPCGALKGHGFSRAVRDIYAIWL